MVDDDDERLWRNVFDNTDDYIDNVLFVSNGNVTWLEHIMEQWWTELSENTVSSISIWTPSGDSGSPSNTPFLKIIEPPILRGNFVVTGRQEMEVFFWIGPF